MVSFIFWVAGSWLGQWSMIAEPPAPLSNASRRRKCKTILGSNSLGKAELAGARLPQAVAGRNVGP